MSTAKQPPAAPNTDALDRATADARETAAKARETVAQAEALCRRLDQLIAVVGAVVGEVIEYQKAQRVFLDIDARVQSAATSNGKEVPA